MGNAKAKKKIVRALTKERQQVFMAINALELGVNATTIRVMIYVGLVRRLRNYAQESGRTGRNGQASEIIILRATQHDWRERLIQKSVK
jgi:superfamily II DNA helicase RecQ